MSAIIVVMTKIMGYRNKYTHTHTHSLFLFKNISPFALPTTDINIIMTVIIHTDSHWGPARIIQSRDY